MAKKFKAVFIMEDGEYKEITYDEFETLEIRNRFFVPKGEVLLEVSENDYRNHCRRKRKEKYYTERSTKNKDFSYDMLTTDDFNGEDILISPEMSVEETVEHNIMLEKLKDCLSQLTKDEMYLITALFFEGFSERKLSEITGIPQKTIDDRKHQILIKLKEYLEN